MEASQYFSQGLIKDTKPAENPPGSWVDARNVTVSRGRTLSNERGTSESHQFDKTPIGKVYIDNRKIVFSTDNVNSEIGYFKNNGYVKVLSSNKLNFNTSRPIKATARLTVSGNVLIAWTDGINPPCVLDIDDLPFEVDVDKVPLDDSKLNSLFIFQQSVSGDIEVQSVNDTGGNLKSGAVQFAMAYSNENLARTDIGNLTFPVYISKSSTANGWQKYNGNEGGLPTSKSVSLKLRNLDERFDYVHLVMLVSNNGSLAVVELPKLKISSSEMDFTVTGNETVQDLLLEEILVDRAFYKTAKTLTQVTDRLYLANLVTDSKRNYQGYFNTLKVNYVTQTLSASLLDPSKDPKNIHRFAGFYPGEVYALYGVVHFPDGSVSPAYHIPGREVSYIDLPTSTREDAVINNDGTLMNETNAVISTLGNYLKDKESGATKYFHTRPTANNPNASSNLGFWENQNETYPNDVDVWGSLAGQKVRHHRMPESYQINNGSVLKHLALKSIGLEITGMDLWDQEVLDEIAYVEFFYARKTFSEALVLGQDLTRFEVKNYPGEEEYFGSSGGNWNTGFRDSDTDWFDTGQIDKTRMRSFCFDFVDKPAISPTHVTFQYKLKSTALNTAYTNLNGFEVKREVVGNEVDGSGRKTNLHGVLDYSESAGTVNITDGSFNSTITPSTYLERVISNRYIPANIDNGLLVNRWGSEHLSIETTGAPDVQLPLLLLRYSSNGSFRNIYFSEDSYLHEEVWMYNICQIKLDVHNRFYDQELVSTGKFFRDFDSPMVTYGGDTNVSQHSWTETCRVPNFIYTDKATVAEEYYRMEDQSTQGIKIARRMYGYFRKLPSYRHVDEANDNSLYYNQQESVDFLSNFRRNIPESFLYNPDYSLKGSTVNVSAYNPFSKKFEKFPNRIIRSVVQPLEQNEVQWNRFLPGDYYEMQKNRGEIVNLEGETDKLLIHCKDSLFVTRSNDTFRGDENDITISSGDIFQLPPKELIVSDTGYCGLESQFHAERFKVGYVFADTVQGKVFLVSDGIEEISSKGMKYFFRDNIRFEFTDGSPYLDNGVVFGFDEENNRILITKKEIVPLGLYGGVDPTTPENGTMYTINGKLLKYVSGVFVEPSNTDIKVKSFTLSYGETPEGSWKWISFHDYVPMFYLSDRVNMFTVYNNKLFIHNQLFRSFYGNVYRSTIDLVFNYPKGISKVFYSLRWLSEVVDTDMSIRGQGFDLVWLYNSYQSSGYLSLAGAKFVENEKRFNEFMDISKQDDLPMVVNNEPNGFNLDPNMAYFKQRKFIDKFVVVRMVYTNSLSKDIFLYSLDANFRHSSN